MVYQSERGKTVKQFHFVQALYFWYSTVIYYITILSFILALCVVLVHGKTLLDSLPPLFRLT